MKKVIKILAPTLTFIVFAVTINWGYGMVYPGSGKDEV